MLQYLQNHIFKIRLTALFLALLLILPTFLQKADATSFDDTVRVGLFYGSSVLPTANLANEVGSGYAFGYFDGDDFVTVGSTSEEKITICKDRNLYASGGSYYETPTVGDYSLLGAYHLQLNETYSSFSEAAAAAASYPYGFPAYAGGSYVVRFEFYSSKENASEDAANYSNVTVVGNSDSCYTVTVTGTNQILFEYDAGSGNYFAVMPQSSGAAAQTWFKGYQYYGGFEYCRRTGGDLTVINYVDLEDYVAGVLPYEMSASWPIETLKAGAIAARTYVCSSTSHTALGFDVCATTDCQVYHGVYTGVSASNVTKAAKETAGECIYYNGQLIDAVYHSADGGATESSLNTWGTDHAYLVGKVDPYETQITHPSSSWSYEITGDEMAEMLQDLGYACQTIVKVEITEYTAMGNVNAIVLTDAAGETFRFTKDNVRVFQNIPGVTYFSRRFTVTAPGETSTASSGSGSYSVQGGEGTTKTDTLYALTEDGVTEVTTGTITALTGSGTATVGGGNGSTTTNHSDAWLFTGSGYGHNVGMSQYGAYAMGLQGFTYEEILQFYYTGVTIR
jgi:stage II sporulation protein D